MDSQLDVYTAAKRLKALHEQHGGVWAIELENGKVERVHPPQAPPVVHLPLRRENRPRERRPQRARVRSSRGDPEEDPDRAHALDRMVSAATWRAQRARARKGYEFKIPPGAVR